MEKQNFNSNKRYNKIKPKTPIANKRQSIKRPLKSNKSNTNNNKTQRKSPKTIDYEQIMEKYGNMIDENLSKLYLNRKNKKTVIKSPDRIYIHSNFNKTQINDNPFTNFNEEEKNNLSTNNNNNKNKKNKNLNFNKLIRNQKKLQIASIKTMNKKNSVYNHAYILKSGDNNKQYNRCNSNNSNIKTKNRINNDNNNSEFEKLKKEIFYLKQENEKLRANTITHNNLSNIQNIDNFIYDKFLLLLNLCRKYAKKFNKLYSLCELELSKYDINPEIFEDLKNTISQYNTMIFSDKITNLFKIKNNENLNNDYENILNPLDISNFEPKSIAINMVDKYKSLIKKLKEENKEYQKKYEETTKENDELKKKIEEFIIKENKYNYQINVIENLKCQVETLNNSIKFKESQINNLQNIIKKNKANQNLFCSNSNSEQNLKLIKEKSKSQISDNVMFNNRDDINDFNLIKNIKDINRYDNNNNIISKITISSYNENLNSNNNSNIFTNKNSLENTTNLNNIIKNNNINNIENENVNIKTPSNKKNIKSQNNFSYEQENIDTSLKNKKEKNILNDEIEQLDQEIINLKSKLTQIIKK